MYVRPLVNLEQGRPRPACADRPFLLLHSRRPGTLVGSSKTIVKAAAALSFSLRLSREYLRCQTEAHSGFESLRVPHAEALVPLHDVAGSGAHGGEFRLEGAAALERVHEFFMRRRAAERKKRS